MRIFGISFLLALMAWCCNEKKTATLVAEKPDVLNYIQVTRNTIKTSLPSLCDTFAIEFEGLYANLESLPGATIDSIFIDDILLENGFKVINSGRGNWQYGPRFIMLELVRDSCYCSIYKKYYDQENTSKLKVTERLICNTHKINGVQKLDE